MQVFLIVIAIFVGLFWRSFTKTNLGAIALAVTAIIGINLVFDVILFLVTKNAVYFYALQILCFVAASLVWLMIFSGRGVLCTFIVLVFLFFSAFSFPVPKIKIAGTITIGIVSILLFIVQRGEIKLFFLGIRERLKEKNQIIDKWLLPTQVYQCDIVLLTASSGSGHMVAARNIANEIEKIAPDKKIKCVNVFDYLGSNFRNLQEAYWEYLATYAPNFYRPIHRFVLRDFKRLVIKKAKAAAALIQEKLETTPSVIVATHPMAVAIGSALKEIAGSKLVIVPTDYYVHPHYTAPNTDLYCLPSGNCSFVGVKREEILLKSVVTGIPIFPSAAEIDRYKAREKLGIPNNVPVVFINFGKAGLMRPKTQLELIFLIAFYDKPCHFLFPTNMSEALGGIAEQEVQATCSLIDDVQLALSVSDVMIGKVGGLSISEAMAHGVPIGIWTHAGPEDFNAKFLMKNNLAVKVGGFREFLFDFSKTKKWISFCAERKEKRFFKQNESARKIAEAILKEESEKN